MPSQEFGAFFSRHEVSAVIRRLRISADILQILFCIKEMRIIVLTGEVK
jgi:hypothetical protein